VELRQVRYFLSVAKHRSFTRAAAELYVVQPALSQQIKRLERELGVDLFDRRGGHVALTTAGVSFQRRAEAIVMDVNVAVAEMRGFSTATTGRVAVGAMTTLSSGAIDFPTLFSRFSRGFPGVQVHFRESTTDGLLNLLRNGQLDLAVLDLEFVTDPSDLTVEPITDENLVVLVTPGHRLASEGHCRLEDLADERFIRLGLDTVERPMKLTRAAEQRGFKPRFAFYAGSVPIARALVAEGLGVHVTHPWVGEGHGPTVATLRLDDVSLRCRVVVAQIKDAYRSPSVLAFLTFAREALHFRGLSPALANGKNAFPLV
jgi:DNA-binding transcriptional LysR family regulator